MARPGFPRDVEVFKAPGGLRVRWQPPEYGETPDRYIVLLRDGDGKRVEGSRQVVQASAPLEAEYSDLGEGQTYKVGVRSRLGRQKGRWLYYVVTIGDDLPPLRSNSYMYFIEAGEPTPEDALAKPTRRVKLYDDGWRRYDPVRAYITTDTWWHFNEVALAEERLEKVKADVADWEEENPETPDPVMQAMLKVAQAEVQALRAQLKTRERDARVEAEAKYPPENLTQEDARWVERPRRHGG